MRYCCTVAVELGATGEVSPEPSCVLTWFSGGRKHTNRHRVGRKYACAKYVTVSVCLQKSAQICCTGLDFSFFFFLGSKSGGPYFLCFFFGSCLVGKHPIVFSAAPCFQRYIQTYVICCCLCCDPVLP